MPGLELNRRFYHEIVGPLMARKCPEVEYAAALVGNGSDVLGFDDPTSMDHNWGPRMRMMLPEKNFQQTKNKIDRMLRKNLPYEFMGYPTNFTEISSGYLKQQMKAIESGEVNHLIRFYTNRSFFEHYLGFDINQKLTIEDWLTFPDQGLLEVSSGEVYHDDIGFKEIRKKFAEYPQDVWYYVMWVQWGRMTNELAFQARSAIAGDELGSRLITARMIRRIIKMAFLLERKYAPYSKWFGFAFKQLITAERLEPLLIEAIDSDDWQERQRSITEAHRQLGLIHNERKITKRLPVKTFDFHGRGYKVFDMEPYIIELKKLIKDKKLRNMKFELGSVDQFIDHTRINHENYVYRELKAVIK